MGIADKPRITVLNKIDMLLPADKKLKEEEALAYFTNPEIAGPPPAENTVLVSAVKKWGFRNLFTAIDSVLSENQPSPENTP